MIGLQDISYITETIEGRITDPPDTKHLPYNKWLLASAMQKAIRRGEADLAVQCAANLHRVDKRMLWRRLSIIALEDCCDLSDGSAVAEILAVAASSSLRRKTGDLNAALYCVRRLAEAVKSRAVTHAFYVSEASAVCREARDTFPGLDDKELTDIALNRKQAVGCRALSLWFIAGTDRYRSERLCKREDNLDLAMEIMTEMKCPVSVIQTCILSLKKSQYPLALLTPLLFDIYGDQQHEIIKNNLPKTEMVRGLPLYSLDQYTRSGKQAIRQWKKQSPYLKGFRPRQIETALFKVESGVLDREILNEPLRDLKQVASSAIFFMAGIYENQQQELLTIVQEKLPELNFIRKQVLIEELDNKGLLI